MAKATKTKLSAPAAKVQERGAYEITTIEAAKLRIHPVAQRQLKPAHLKDIADNLDLDAIGIVHAVRYAIGNTLGIWVIDGQHRVRALLDHGFGEWEVEVKIHLDVKNDEEACALFLLLNKRAAVSPFWKFHNELQAKKPIALLVDKTVKSFGLKISPHAAEGTLNCVSALKKVAEMDEGEGRILFLTLGTLVSVWGRAGGAAFEGKMVEGLATVFEHYKTEIDQAALVKKLAKYAGGAAAVMGDAKGLRSHRKTSLARCVAELISECYNSGRRFKRLGKL